MKGGIHQGHDRLGGRGGVPSIAFATGELKRSPSRMHVSHSCVVNHRNALDFVEDAISRAMSNGHAKSFA